MSERVKEVADAIIQGIRRALTDTKVTSDEYRAAVTYLKETAENGELPLMIDVFFNITIVENENSMHAGTQSDLQGPYYLPDAPFIEGEIKTMDEFNGKPVLVRGTVTDTDGSPVADAILDIWQSTPDGKYSGIHDNIPVDYYRGKVRTNADGSYEVRTTEPVPYQIPAQGKTGALLRAMGSHTWRPAHIHFKVEKEGFHPITLQAYFEGGDYVGDDCCSGKCNEGQNVIPEKFEDGLRVMEVSIVMDRSAAQAVA
ncbi:MAG: dioxygenase [Pseudomonadales bacterium]